MNGLLRKSLLVLLLLGVTAYVGYKMAIQILHGFNKYHFIDNVELAIETSDGPFSGEIYGKAFRGADRPFEPNATGTWDYPNHLREVLVYTSAENRDKITSMTFQLDTFQLVFSGEQLQFSESSVEINGQQYTAWKLNTGPEDWPNVSNVPYLKPILNWRGDYHFLRFALSKLFSGNFFFLLKIILFFGWFPQVLYPWFKHRLNEHLDKYLVLALSGIFSLMFTNLLLYYLLILLPHSTELFYIGTVFAIYLGLYFPYRKEHIQRRKRARESWSSVGHRLKEWEQKLVEQKEYHLKITRHDLLKAVRSGVFVFLGILVLCIGARNSVHTLDGSADIFEYAATGKALAQSKSIDFLNPFYNGPGSFTRHSFHAPGFVLLMTWESLVNSFFSVDEIRWYKVVNLFLAVMMLIGVFRLVKQKGEWLAWLAVIALLASFSFLSFGLNNHIDMLRIATLYSAILMAGLFLQKPSTNLAALFGMALGFSAFSHSMNTILAVGLAGITLLVAKNTIGDRVKSGIITGLFFLAFGAIHYALDMAIGTGWIFR
ncbi:hypothetical protein KFE98_00390 [bacterium SCSIO 12741]|nr:hypothetical protein KFE98_00390 [bacterium SCSIO 12741]